MNGSPLVRIDKIKNPVIRRQMLIISVYELFRWHLVDDCVARELIKRNNNKMDENSVALIARNYQVARTLEMKDNKQKITSHMNEAADHWPDDLIKRAEHCRKWATIFQREGLSSRNCLPASAITKFIWFLRPDNWTLFDSFASKAILTEKPKENSADRMVRFYCELDERNFTSDAKTIQKIINNDKFSQLAGNHPLAAGRVIDKFLMLSGMNESARKQSMDYTEIFYSNLPIGMMECINNLAEDIADCCTDSLLKYPRERNAI